VRLNVTPDEEVEIARRQWDCDIGNEALARRYHSLLKRSRMFSGIPALDVKSSRFPSRFDNYLLHRILDRNSSTQPLLAYDYENEDLVVLRWLRHYAFSLEDPRRARDIMTSFETAMTETKDLPRVLSAKSWGVLGQRPYYTVAFSADMTLDRLLSLEAVSEQRALFILRELSKILTEAHRKDVVHTQLSTKSIVIRGSEIWIRGFEKWRFRNQRLRWGQSGAILLPFIETLSPEQIGGMQAYKSTDVYQVGLIMYRLLTGRHPFQDSFMKPFRVLTREILKGPRDPRDFAADLSPKLSKICMTALAKESEGRFTSMAEFQRVLDTYLS
ncbi:MAG: hypothetical protein P1V97_33930, partial [Planctomycetota bacterium]|nr:hypothetical protein [Planctomycetota bacterium]